MNMQEINTDYEEIIVFPKIKKNTKKTNTKPLAKKIEFIIEEDCEEKEKKEEKYTEFISQIKRMDILANILLHIILPGKILFDLLMSDNNSEPNDSRRGDIFESICEIMVILKCIPEINYSHILCGDILSLKTVTNVKTILCNQIHQGGNVSDITIELDGAIIAFSSKYKKKVSRKGTDISDLDSTLKKHTSNYKIGLFVKDKQTISDSKKQDIHKDIFEKVRQDNLLFDENDIVKALEVFCNRYKDNIINGSVNDFMERINAELLASPRKQLVEKLHQRMTITKFKNSIEKNNKKMWCIAHKPRSGKSITILLICKYLLENGHNKILIMTSVPATINSFIKDLEDYIDFKDIKYINQNEFASEISLVKGIVFCSVQYLKSDIKGTKREFLKNMGFDAIVTDESHQGSSTLKTRTGILDVDVNVEDIRKNIKLNIFASGTANKTKKYFNISSAFVYEWEIEDEGHMKELENHDLTQDDRTTIINYMSSRHGPTFSQCINDITLDKDYSKHPTQVLMKHTIPESLVKEIQEYNAKYNATFGFSYSSLFALKQFINTKGEAEYAEEFDICKDSDGIDIIKGLFEVIVSKNKMNEKTIMKQIERIQTSYNSRKSTVDCPLLFIMYLPTHTGNNTISLLQKTMKTFLETHHLWSEYNIEYANSLDDTGVITEEYDVFIESIMNKTKADKKRGCILLLGNKGSVGITYNECDVTIALDDGHNLDNYQQRVSRSLTPAPLKTVGISVDLNIQRTYLYVIDIIQRHRINTRTTKTNAEILYYLFEHKIFLFDPQQINNGKLSTTEIMSYYQKEAENLMKGMDDTPFLENIVCDDDLRDIIKLDFQKKNTQIKCNEDLEGLQQDCPKGDKTKIQIDAPTNLDVSDSIAEELAQKEDSVLEELINQTYEMCKGFLFPLLALISRAYKIFDFKEIFTNEVTGRLIISLLKDKKIELNISNYSIIINIMNQIIDNNAEIVNNIREIYSIAPAHKLRELIAKHFIPTAEEKKGNAEVPTPVILVEQMLTIVPVVFWTTPKKVFEPCSGKGNFVLGIFDRFYKGLEELYPDNEERCRVIMTECIYYADLTALNVFITTEIMKCHVQSCCGLEELDFEFNCYTGDTLLLNISETFGLASFDAVIGNPPYNDDSGNKGKGHTLWTKFIENSLNDWLNIDGYLLFVNPSLWRQPEHPLQALMKSKQIIYLEIHDEKDGVKTFGCNTRYDVYLIQNTSYKNPTLIKTQKGEIENIDLREWAFIPNYDFDIIGKIITGNEKINIIHSESKYEVRRPHMAHNESDIFKYPCIYSVNRSNELSFKWSNTRDKGMFDIPKVIFGSGATGFIIDEEGKYGLTQWATGIVDDIENLESIKNVLNSVKFKDIILATSVSKAEINRKILKYFKRDFWQEFV